MKCNSCKRAVKDADIYQRIQVIDFEITEDLELCEKCAEKWDKIKFSKNEVIE